MWLFVQNYIYAVVVQGQILQVFVIIHMQVALLRESLLIT